MLGSEENDERETMVFVLGDLTIWREEGKFEILGENSRQLQGSVLSALMVIEEVHNTLRTREGK